MTQSFNVVDGKVLLSLIHLAPDSILLEPVQNRGFSQITSLQWASPTQILVGFVTKLFDLA